MASTKKLNYIQDYNAKFYKQVNIRISKEDAELIDKALGKSGMSKASFIQQAVKEKLERDGYAPKCRYEVLCDDKVIYSTNSLDDAERRLLYETEYIGNNGHYKIVENELK